MGVLNIFRELGYLMDARASAELRRSARHPWNKYVQVLRRDPSVKPPTPEGPAPDLRALAALAVREHQLACWPKGSTWAMQREQCCHTGSPTTGTGKELFEKKLREE